MNVSRDRLSVIGKLIGIYREERRSNTLNQFTIKGFCEGICSPNTLKSIENGGLSRSNEVYEELLSKLNLKFNAFKVIDDATKNQLDDLYIAIEYYDEMKISSSLRKLLRILSEVKGYVYYSELYDLFCNLQLYYEKDEYVSNDYVERYLKLLEVLDYEYLDLLRILIYSKRKTESMCDVSKFNELIYKLNLESSKHDFMKINLLQIYYIQSKYLKMYELINTLEERFISKANHTRLLDVYNCAIILVSNIDSEKVSSFIMKEEKLLANMKVPPIKLSEVYSNLGTAYYVMKKYNEALRSYETMINIYSVNFITNYIYMADCQNRLGLERSIPIIDEDKYINAPDDIKIMYKYFLLSKDIPVFVKKNYIMKKVLPNLVDSELIDIFKFELNNLVKISNHYKLLHLFNEYINEKKS